MVKPKRSSEPHDRLTKLTEEMTAVLTDKGDAVEDVKCVVLLQDGKRGGLQTYNYEDDAEAMTDLLLHLRAIFEANGKTLIFAPLSGSPGKN